MANLVINNQTFDLQRFVINSMKLLISVISETELANLQDKQYCSNTFGLNFPLLSKDRKEYLKDKNHYRYYAQNTFFEKNLYLCNDWYDKNANKFLAWFLSFFSRK